MLYFAFGSNLCLDNMRRRCPRAMPVGKLILHDARLVFRSVADCIYEPGAECPGALYRLSPDCEPRLDRFEGANSGSYRKEYFDYQDEQVLHYVMNSNGIFPPSKVYFDMIRQGYRDFKLPMAPLYEAVRHAWQEKAPSHYERLRYRRLGRPVLIKITPKTGTPLTGNANGKSRSV
jgi:Gamma-glutamyl cyclotransferase, AIG2-like